MKKRLMSILLTICMVTALFSGLSVSAAADNDTIQHTLKSGETVIGVCQKLGINYYANAQWIKETNKITNYNNLKVGTVLTLPAPGTTPGKAPAPTAPAPGGGSVNKSMLPGDTVVSYLVPHTMQRGETVSGVCSALGINFTANSEQIQKINNIQDYKRIFAGRTIYLPMPKPPASGPCVAVVAHKVVGGDAMYNICGSYGIDYNSGLRLIQSLNGRTDSFSSIKVGETILLPVSTVYTQNNGGNGGTPVTPGGSGGNNGNGGNGGNGGKPVTPGASYNISVYKTKGGSLSVASSAKDGEQVSIKVTPDKNYKLGYISVTNTSNVCIAKVTYNKDGSASFVMPNCKVIVAAQWVEAEATKGIVRGEGVNGDFMTYVNGVASDSATPGQAVQIAATPRAGYEVKSYKVTFNNGKDSVHVNVDGTFIMPEGAVKVDVSFQRAQEYKLSKNDPGHGTVDIKVNNRLVSKAESGETVTVVATPKKGFVLSEISIRYNGQNIKLNGNTFTMPAADVEVTVKFSKDVFNISIKQTPNGSIYIDRTTAAKGQTVNVFVTPAANCSCTGVSVNGEALAYDGSSGSFPFIMPASDVTVTATFKVGTQAVNLVFDSAKGKVTASNMYPQVGDMIDVNIEPKKGFDFETMVVTTVNQGQKNVPVSGTTFQMPNDDVNVAVTFKAHQYNVELLPYSNGYVELSKTNAAWGDTVTINYTPYGNAKLGKIVVTNAATGEEVTVKGINASSSSFEMPNDDVKISIIFNSVKKFAIKNTGAFEEGTLTAKVDGVIASEAEAGQTVTVSQITNFGYIFEGYYVTNEATGQNVEITDGTTFIMPAADVKFHPIYKKA